MRFYFSDSKATSRRDCLFAWQSDAGIFYFFLPRYVLFEHCAHVEASGFSYCSIFKFHWRGQPPDFVFINFLSTAQFIAQKAHLCMCACMCAYASCVYYMCCLCPSDPFKDYYF